ncbi:olfactory receptor family 13 subfamily D member 1 [Homo sapiens]|uniref:Olfactory receptor 13D1 n=2 Tax=Homo sapiens TaxID=9606 RepID=O13D1_HUMAN|eukprot:NP_001004484.1 olfactory receptor 13D1 [Homo sapiens]
MYRFTDFDVSNISIYLNHVLFYTTQQAGDLEHMETRNYSAMTEFFLVGLSQYPELQLFLFLLCLIMYMIILLGNSLLIIITILDSRLHTPMYFFLGNLSFLDICYTSSSIPPMLIIFMSERKSISFIGCALQMVVSLGLGSTECVLLAVMAYDHYVAICNPLRYSIIMNGVLYVQMAAWSWIIGCLTSLLQTVLTMMLPFCGNNVIDHITCEILALLKLVCSDITINVLIMTVTNIVSLVILLLLIFISYVFILSSILRINCAEGRKKAFSTCSAHSIVVILFYGSALFMYMKPKSKNTNTSDEIIGLSYGVVSPMLNPIIYSLRNKEVKEAVKKVLSRHLHLLKM